MTFQLTTLFLVAVAYLGVLFLIAHAVDRGKVPSRIVRHPAIFVLSLGVYATSWSYYGSVGYARVEGANYLAIYLGVTAAFLIWPILLRPLLRLTRDLQLSSLADVFAFRYRSHAAGALVTLFMLIGLLPYIALQIRAVTQSLQVLSDRAAPETLALGFCLMLILFAILFGARHATPRDRHSGLVVAIAFESAVKLIALLLAGAFALFGVFGGPSGLNEWLKSNPDAIRAMHQPIEDGPWLTLLLLSFAAAFLLPRQFHMLFTENGEERNLRVAAWAFPLYLLALNIAIPPVLWAGSALLPDGNPDYYLLSITLFGESPWLPLLVFIGGVSAASAMVIVTTLALAGMSLNHLLLPASLRGRREPFPNFYRWLSWGRRILIAMIVGAGFGFYLLAQSHQGLVEMGLISFVAVAQFLPGVLGLFYWRRATRAGFISGLLGGAIVWGYLLIAPLLHGGMPPGHGEWLVRLHGGGLWETVTFWSLALNVVLFVAVSLLTEQDADEQAAAQACCRESLLPLEGLVEAESPEQFEARLATAIGEDTARQEVQRALEDLSLTIEESRPNQLRRLRERIERNLSGLLGPLMARAIVDNSIELDTTTRTALADTVRFMEQRLDDSRSRLQGLAAELDRLRRYHRQVLQELPLGVCSLDPEREVVIWNQTMGQLSGIDGNEVASSRVASLPEPWGGLLNRFAASPESHLYKLQVKVAGEAKWFNLYKAAIGSTPQESGGVVILVEDLTEQTTLEAEVAHSERLASIGRLAAGVAHEIGNPLTGIASMVQNLRDESDPRFINESIDLVLEQARRIRDIVQTLVTFSHGGAPVMRDHLPIPLAACLQEAIQLIRLGRETRRMAVDCNCPLELEVRGDHPRLVQVFVNLLNNAADASPARGEIRLTASARNGMVEIAVEDQGEGIPLALQQRVFEPFFTTKPPGHGTGLGLPLVHTIIEDHGGQLRLFSEPGLGTRVVISLPQA